MKKRKNKKRKSISRNKSRVDIKTTVIIALGFFIGLVSLLLISNDTNVNLLKTAIINSNDPSVDNSVKIWNVVKSVESSSYTSDEDYCGSGTLTECLNSKLGLTFKGDTGIDDASFMPVYINYINFVGNDGVNTVIIWGKSGSNFKAYGGSYPFDLANVDPLLPWDSSKLAGIGLDIDNVSLAYTYKDKDEIETGGPRDNGYHFSIWDGKDLYRMYQDADGVTEFKKINFSDINISDTSFTPDLAVYDESNSLLKIYQSGTNGACYQMDLVTQGFSSCDDNSNPSVDSNVKIWDYRESIEGTEYTSNDQYCDNGTLKDCIQEKLNVSFIDNTGIEDGDNFAPSHIVVQNWGTLDDGTELKFLAVFGSDSSNGNNNLGNTFYRATYTENDNGSCKLNTALTKGDLTVNGTAGSEPTLIYTYADLDTTESSGPENGGYHLSLWQGEKLYRMSGTSGSSTFTGPVTKSGDTGIGLPSDFLPDKSVYNHSEKLLKIYQENICYQMDLVTQKFSSCDGDETSIIGSLIDGMNIFGYENMPFYYEDVDISLLGNGKTMKKSPNSSGIFTFSELTQGTSYEITPSKVGYEFDPAKEDVTTATDSPTFEMKVANCSGWGMDLASKKDVFDISDTAFLNERLSEIEVDDSSEKGRDINRDGIFDIADVISLQICLAGMWDWTK